MATPRLSIVVPCYNEEKNIPLIVERFRAALNGREEAELVLVDNGSRDGTGQAIDREIHRQGALFARKVTVETNIGYGFGILSGLKASAGEILAWTHADLQTDPKDVLDAYAVYTEAARSGRKVLVKGRRVNRRPHDAIFSIGMQLLASLALGTWLEEINAQPKLFSRALFEAMKNPPNDFSLDLYALATAKRLGYGLLSIPVRFGERRYGEAKGGGGASLATRWKLIRHSARYIFELKRALASQEPGHAVHQASH